MLINEKQIPTVHIKLVDNCVNGQGLSVETMSLYISLIRNLPSGPTQYLQNPTRTASRTSFILQEQDALDLEDYKTICSNSLHKDTLKLRFVRQYYSHLTDRWQCQY
jgi:hypothetical protein